MFVKKVMSYNKGRRHEKFLSTFDGDCVRSPCERDFMIFALFFDER